MDIRRYMAGKATAKLAVSEKQNRGEDQTREEPKAEPPKPAPAVREVAGPGEPGTKTNKVTESVGFRAREPRARAPEPGSAAAELWVDKHRPMTAKDLVGNAGPIATIRAWLQRWHSQRAAERRDNGRDQEGKKPRGKKKERAVADSLALLLSGPPGTGKTSAVHLLAAEGEGFELFELNASNARSRKLIRAALGAVLHNTVLAGHGRRRLVLLDEVDGMSTADTGGMAELIRMLETTGTPVVCICNDRQKPSVKSLARHTLDVRFERPGRDAIVARLRDIATKEGLRTDENAVAFLVEASGCDVRHSIQALQMWRAGSSKLSNNDMFAAKDTAGKDEAQRLNTFDAAQRMFTPQASLQSRFDAFFVDIDLSPLFVAQNWIDACRVRKVPAGANELDLFVRAADAVCDVDVVDHALRRDQNWFLLETSAMMTVRAASACGAAPPRPAFPELLGRTSTATKRRRLLGDLASRSRFATGGAGAADLRLDYLPHLRRELLAPLLGGGKAAVPETLARMKEYGLNRDDLFEGLAEFALGDEDTQFAAVPVPVKAALTREYNRANPDPCVEKTKSKTKTKKDAAQDDDLPEQDDEEEEPEENGHGQDL